MSRTLVAKSYEASFMAQLSISKNPVQDELSEMLSLCALKKKTVPWQDFQAHPICWGSTLPVKASVTKAGLRPIWFSSTTKCRTRSLTQTYAFAISMENQMHSGEKMKWPGHSSRDISKSELSSDQVLVIALYPWHAWDVPHWENTSTIHGRGNQVAYSSGNDLTSSGFWQMLESKDSVEIHKLLMVK